MYVGTDFSECASPAPPPPPKKKTFAASATLAEAFTAAQAHVDPEQVLQVPVFSLKMLHPKMEFTHQDHAHKTFEVCI